MLRWIKYGVGAIVVAGAAGFLLLGSNFGSYIRTSTNAAQEAARNAVPVEFELRRASDMIEAIIPDLQSQIRMIAQEEVEIASLEADISESSQRLHSEQNTLTALRGKMRTQQVSYSVNGRDMERNELTDQLHQRFERFKQGELALASKKKLLEKRNDGLNGALAMLDKMRHRKGELEQKVEALAAQHRLVQASAIEAGNLIDGSRLSEADQLLQQIETRLAVAQRVLSHEQNVFPLSTVEDYVDEQELLTQLDNYFGTDKTSVNGEAVVVGFSKPVEKENRPEQ